MSGFAGEELNYFLGVVVGLVFVCVVSTGPQSRLRYTCLTTEGNTTLPKQVRICLLECLHICGHALIMKFMLFTFFSFFFFSFASALIRSVFGYQMFILSFQSSFFHPHPAFLPQLHLLMSFVQPQ